MEMDGNLPFLTSTYAGDQMTPWAIRSTENQPKHLYLNHPSNLQALLSTLVHRARAPCDKKSLHDELESPKTMFKENGYNITQIRHVLNLSVRTSMPVQKLTSVTVLPYVWMTYSSSTECSPNLISDVLACHLGRSAVPVWWKRTWDWGLYGYTAYSESVVRCTLDRLVDLYSRIKDHHQHTAWTTRQINGGRM